MSENIWTPFANSLPRVDDADHLGEVYLLEQNGNQRRGMWNWISPFKDGAAQIWRANGFTAWRKI